MIDARDFLDAVAGYANAPTNGPKSSATRPTRLGTVDPYYTSGTARVLFDGENVLSSRGYSWVSSYTPKAGERVYLVPVGQTYLIGGSLMSSVPYSRYNDLQLLSGYSNYSATFHNPSFTKTESGLVKLAGMVSNTNTGTLGNYDIIATLPEGFRPSVDMLFPVMTGAGNTVGTVGIKTSGEILTRNAVQGIWFSLGNIVFQTQELDWTTPALASGWEVGLYSKFMRQPQYAVDSAGRTLLRGSFGETGTSPTADSVVFTVDSAARPFGQVIYTVATALTGPDSFAHTVSSATTGTFSWRMGSGNDDEVSIDGTMYPPRDASWTAPTLLNGWVSYSTGSSPGYYKDSDGVVYLRGLVKTGTIAQAAFNLPAGYRPAKNIIRVTPSNQAIGRLDITAGGNVVPQAGSNTWFSLDSVSFTAEA